MSDNDNIVKSLVTGIVDVVFLCSKVTIDFTKWCFDGWIDFDKNPKDLNYFYESIGLKNKLNEYPKVVKKYSDKCYILTVPVGLSLQDFTKSKDSLETYLDGNVELTLNNGYVAVIKKVDNNLKEIVPYEATKRTTDYIKFNIGEGLNEAITLDLKENPHSYIVGTTGSGKSVMTKVILTTLVNMFNAGELELFLCDLKMVELAIFRNLKHTKKFVYTVNDTTEVIADLLEETKKRYELFLKHEVTDIFEYNKLKGVKKLKYQVLFVEEIVCLLEDKSKNAMKLLKQLISISRASGCYVFLTTQRPDNTIIDNVVKANINNRIVFKCEDSKNSVVALDREGAESLKGNGHGLIKRGSDIQEFKGYFISNEEVKNLIKPYIKPKDNIMNESHNNFNKQDLSSNDNINDLSFLDKL